MAAVEIVLAILATWRLSHLLSKEDGPGDIIFRIRVRLGNGFWGKLMDCFKCLSLWVAAPIAVYITRKPLELVLVWLALSGGAWLLERTGRDSVVIQPVSQLQEGEVQNELLWSEARNAQEHGGEGDDSRPPPTGAENS